MKMIFNLGYRYPYPKCKQCMKFTNTVLPSLWLKNHLIADRYTPGLAWLPSPQSIHPAQSPFLYKVKGLVPSSSMALLPSNQYQGLLIMAFVFPSFEAWFPGLRILKHPWSYSSLILSLLPWCLISPFSSSNLPVLPDATTAELTVKI